VVWIFKGLSHDMGLAKFAENLRTSPFSKELSTTFSLIDLAVRSTIKG
jgi:hypothetical protein